MEKFSIEANGYNRDEVNQFVKDVIKETEDIIIRVKEQNKEIEMLKKELEQQENKEIIQDYYVKNAEKESELIIKEAKINASRIVNEALIKAEKIENSSEMLEKNMKLFKKKLHLILEQQKAVVEEIEILELE